MQILGMDQGTFSGLILLLLLIILGVVSFNQYYYIRGQNGLQLGAGANIGILTKRQ